MICVQRHSQGKDAGYLHLMLGIYDYLGANLRMSSIYE